MTRWRGSGHRQDVPWNRDLRRLDGRRRQIVATLVANGWRTWPDPDGQQWAFPPLVDEATGRRVALPGTLVSERQARNLETALRSIGPYPREER